jgi:hypothetical protein
MPRKVEKRTVYTLKHLDKMPSGKADGFLAQAAGKIVALEALVEFTDAGKPNFIWKGGVILHGAELDREKAVEKAKKSLAKKIKATEKRLERLRRSLENTEVFEQTSS